MNQYKTISFRVTSNQYAQLQELAKTRYQSLSAYIRKCLDSQLQ